MSDADSDHLDADELSAFAENALPAAARARYTEHLADCSKCREIVVQLSGSVPVVAARETVAVPASSGLRKFLASFFSPMVLRYAVPALGLIIVTAIGFVVLRSRKASIDVAQAPRQVQSPAPTSNAEESTISGFYNSNDERKESSSAAVTRQSDTEKPLAAAAEPPPPNAPESSDIASPKTDAPAKRPAEEAAANAAPARAEPAPAPSPTVDEMRVDVQGRRNEQSDARQAKELAKQKTVEVAQDQEKKTGEFQSAREAPRPAARARAMQGAGTASVEMADKAEKDRDDGETRSVAGRRFRKQNGVWVDTAYSSGGSRANIARGSERYRALVADEPEIKKIADQLDGPIIVVWKGRIYEIR